MMKFFLFCCGLMFALDFLGIAVSITRGDPMSGYEFLGMLAYASMAAMAITYAAVLE